MSAMLYCLVQSDGSGNCCVQTSVEPLICSLATWPSSRPEENKRATEAQEAKTLFQNQMRLHMFLSNLSFLC